MRLRRNRSTRVSCQSCARAVGGPLAETPWQNEFSTAAGQEMQEELRPPLRMGAVQVAARLREIKGRVMHQHGVVKADLSPTKSAGSLCQPEVLFAA